jgi:hypothetical protein
MTSIDPLARTVLGRLSENAEKEIRRTPAAAALCPTTLQEKRKLNAGSSAHNATDFLL